MSDNRHDPGVHRADAQFLIDLLKQLVRRPAVVGAELAFLMELRRELEEAGARVTLYEGLLVAEGPDPDSMRISAHVDRHGLICTGPNEFQYAAFIARNRGDLTGDSISEQTFRTIAGRFAGQGVTAYDPWSGAYLGRGRIASTFLCERRGNVIFEMDGLGHLMPGTPVGYEDRLRVDDGWLAAQLDNVLCVAMLVELFRRGYAGTAFFTCQEESGRSWRYLLEWFRRHDRVAQDLLVLDTSPFPDRAEAAAQQLVLRHGDVHARFNHGMVDRLEAICRERGIPYRFKDAWIDADNRRRLREGLSVRSIGSTELGRLIAASDGRVQGVTLQVPTTGYHTPQETARVESVLRCLDVLAHLAGMD